jgi:hypothetical protein
LYMVTRRSGVMAAGAPESIPPSSHSVRRRI